MKRELLQNVRVQPYTSGDAVERDGFLSAVLGVKVGTAGALTLTVTHSDDGETYEAVTDRFVFPDAATEGGTYTIEDLEKDAIVCADMDLLGLKAYVKIAASGAAAANSTLALALGDAAEQPV